MQRHKTNKALGCLTLITVGFLTWSIVRSQRMTDHSRPASLANSILFAAQKPKAPISDGSPEHAQFTAAEINDSMRARRDQAWAIVQQVWAPVTVAGSKIPAWMTWYEEQDVAQLYREL